MVRIRRLSEHRQDPGAYVRRVDLDFVAEAAWEQDPSDVEDFASHDPAAVDADGIADSIDAESTTVGIAESASDFTDDFSDTSV